MNQVNASSLKSAVRLESSTPMFWLFWFSPCHRIYSPQFGYFSPTIHLSVAGIAVDSLQSSTCLHVRIKASKTDLFRQGCHIHIGLGRAPLCAVQALVAYLSLRGNVPGPCLYLQMVNPCLAQF